MNKKIIHFNGREMTSENEQAYWDFRAEEYCRDSDPEKTTREKSDLAAQLAAKGILTKDSHVLDIGCGPGTLALALAKYAASVTAIDISPSMLKFAKENAKKNGDPGTLEFRQIDWWQAELSQLGWINKFDLVVASMSPAVCNEETLGKVIDASRGHCWYSTFVQRESPLRRELNSLCSKVHSYDNILHVFNALWKNGFFPELTYADSRYTRESPWDEAVKLYSNDYEVYSLDKKTITEVLKKYCRDGHVIEESVFKRGYLLWSV